MMDYGNGATALNGILEWRDTLVKLYSIFMFSTEEFKLYPAGGSKRKCFSEGWQFSPVMWGFPAENQTKAHETRAT